MSKLMKGNQKDSEKYIWDQTRSPSGIPSQNRAVPKLMLSLILFVFATYAIYTLKLLKSSHSCDNDFTGMAIHSNVNISSVVLNSFHNNNASILTRMEEKTGLQHIVFGIAASSKLWSKRKNYIKLWWKEDEMRGIVWLDNPVKTHESEADSLPELRISGNTSKFQYTNRRGHRSAIRISRIVSETLRLGMENVRWFVMGDDDTVFATENLVRVLNKYDHNQYYYIGSVSESHLQNIYFSYAMAYGGGGFAISYPLAKALEKMQDGCLQRYPGLYGSDERVQACMAELGVPLTKELGFHQYDVYGNLFGLLAAHPLAPFVQRRKIGEAYMEALIPEPTPTNVRKFKKGLWRKTTPKGLKLKKFIKGPDGTLIHDSSFVGEDAWDDTDHPQNNVKEIIERDEKLSTEDKKFLKEDLGISVQNRENQGTWRERLQAWNKILQKDKLAEQLDSLKAQYVVEFDMKEVENSLRKDIAQKGKGNQWPRALWISKRWWRYRPKLPYTYFLQKLDSSEVAAVVFTEDLKRLYITMKEGFPLEYTVDIPLDPYLFETISSSGVEVDLLQKRQLHYLLKVVIALLPGILILWFIRESMMLLHITTRRFLYKKYNQLFDMAYAENFILPVGEVGETKSMYKEVVLGGDVWDLLDELMIYMGNPMQYYEKEVKFVRGVLLSGPPGTGKTLFARTLAKESGLPFVFASGAEFTDSEKSGAARINEMFSVARRNAPAFIFVDEIDAIAGRHARKDPRRRATFEALIAQLDGEKEKTGVDRFSLRQAVIFLCATNRPDELDLEFVRPGRIDRRLYIGLPDAKQRVQIFGVHSAGKQLADDVDFGKLVFRTVGYSGADIRNLVNEAGIMSVRKGHSKIFQQDVIDVLDKQLLEGMGVLLTEEEQQKCEQNVSFEKKRLLAVHEAGHIVLAHLFPRFDWHAFSQLLPGGKETAISVFYPREDMVDQGYTTFGYMKMQMVVAHGGRCAERIVFGDDITDGGQDDLEKITKIAREMVISPGNSRLGLTALTKKLGLVDQPDNPDRELINYKWDDPHVIPADMTVEVSELFTRELTRYINETEEFAMKGLMDNRHLLDMIAQELLQRSRITGLEAEERIRGQCPIMFEDFVKPFQINLDEDGPLPHNDRVRYQPLDIYPAPLHRC